MGTSLALRAHAPLRVLDGFGRAVRAACRYAAPCSVDELCSLLATARREGLSVAFRGAGRSYGDAALNRAGLVVDTSRLDRMRRWDPEHGIAEAEPGLTIEGLWRRTLTDRYWPAVVPGTMRPTLGGCLAMNVHGKNNFQVGPIGEHVLDFDLCTASGELYRCSPSENADIFRAAIGGLGLLGVMTRVRLQLKRVESGYLRVEPIVAPSLDALLDRFEEDLPGSDYLVGWVDCLARGESLGRGVLHRASYLAEAEDPDGAASFLTERQGLPPRILGIPRGALWRLMRAFTNDWGMRLVNAVKHHATRVGGRAPFLQSHVAFAFLLDYVPDWRLAYGPHGFLQYQVFLPRAASRETLHGVLRLAQERGLPPYLGVLKRHRPDGFLLSHAVDGYSLAMDFRVTSATRHALLALTGEITERVIEAGGRFYFAKDAVVRPRDVERAYPRDRLEAFSRLKRRLDPEGLLVSDLARRALPERMVGP